MTEGLNRVMLLGNLGADPELRQTNSGHEVLKLRVATSERYKAQDGEWKERTDWHSVVVWGRRAGALNGILSKGSRLFVEGRLSTSSYEDRDGNKRWRTEVIANNVILGGAASGGGSDRGGGGRSGGAPAGGSRGGYSDEEYAPPEGGYDIPF